MVTIPRCVTHQNAYSGSLQRYYYSFYHFPEVYSQPVVWNIGCKDNQVRPIKKVVQATIYDADKYETHHPDHQVDIEKETLPFKDPLQGIVALHVLEHCDDWRSALINMIESCGSYILIAVPNEYNWLHRYHLLRGIRWEKFNLSTEDSHKRMGHPTDVWEYRFFMEKHGFICPKQRFARRHFDPHQTRLATRILEKLARGYDRITDGPPVLSTQDIWMLFERKEPMKSRE